MADRDTRNNYFKVALEFVHEEEGFNPRTEFGDLQELKRSIIQNGVLVPCIGRLVKGEWFLIEGHRRYRAAKLAEKEGYEILLPIVPQAKGTSDEDRLIATLVTATGKPLEPFEQADVYKRLLNFGWTEKQIADRTAKSTAHVQGMLKYLELDSETKNLVKTGKVSTSAAVETIRKQGAKKAAETIKAAVAKKGSVTSREDLGLSKKVSTDKLNLLSDVFRDEGNDTLADLVAGIKLYMDSTVTLQECVLNLKEIGSNE